MKKALVILILFSGSILTYLLTDFVIDARHDKSDPIATTFDDLLEDGHSDKKSGRRTMKYWSLDRRKLPLIFATSAFLVGCIVLLDNEKLRKKLLE